jgi:hypothetical protein
MLDIISGWYHWLIAIATNIIQRSHFLSPFLSLLFSYCFTGWYYWISFLHEPIAGPHCRFADISSVTSSVSSSISGWISSD